MSSVQLLSCVRFLATPCTAAYQASLSITNSQSLLNSCPLSRWCSPIISSFVILVFSHLQSLPASESFPVSQFFASGGQSIGVSASASVLPINIQDWFPLELTDCISLQSKSLLQWVSSSNQVAKVLEFQLQHWSFQWIFRTDFL